MSLPAGWYDDGRGNERWWDGSGWTEHTRPPEAATAPEPSGLDAPTQVAPQQPAPPAQPHQPASPAQQPAWSQQPPAGGPPLGQPPFVPSPGPGSTSGFDVRRLVLVGGVALVVGVLLLCGVVGVVVVASGGGPDDVTQDYLEASNPTDPDYLTECELSAAGARRSLLDTYGARDCEDYADRQQEEFDATLDEELGSPCDDVSVEDWYDDLDYSVEVGEVDEDGDAAVVEATITQEFTGDDDDWDRCSGGPQKTGTSGFYQLEKDDGDWRVVGWCGETRSACTEP